jgi:hypothetical protein
MKRISQTLVAALGLALAGSAFARYEQDPYFYDYARVVATDRIVSQDSQPVTREDCWQEPLDSDSSMTTPSRVVESTRVSNDGTVRRVETTKKDYDEGYQEHCRQHTDYTAEAPKFVGYDVVYRYRGQDYHDRISYNPGSRVRVRVQDGYVSIAE